MTNRIFNFNAGPATLPLPVLEEARDALVDYKGIGMSVLEISHRSPEYDEINNTAMALTRELMGLDDSFHVLFMTGGASSQFAFIPMNFLPAGKTAAYVDTGTWSAKAIKEAQALGEVKVVASSKEDSYRSIPSDIQCPSDAAYLHITSNNTIAGTQYHSFPTPKGVPLICDMSSDILSHRIPFEDFSLIYAGAQKNLGPSGTTLVVVRDDLLATARDDLPTMFKYKTHADKKSLYNTPPVFAVFLVKLVLEWIKKEGGLEAVETRNQKKKDIIYKLMDDHPDYFKGPVEPQSRSWMNLTMRLPNEDLEKAFIEQAKKAGFQGLKGHRSVGGIRASMYNAMSMEGAEKLAAFALDFKKANPA